MRPPFNIDVSEAEWASLQRRIELLDAARSEARKRPHVPVQLRRKIAGRKPEVMATIIYHQRAS